MKNFLAYFLALASAFFVGLSVFAVAQGSLGTGSANLFIGASTAQRLTIGTGTGAAVLTGTGGRLLVGGVAVGTGGASTGTANSLISGGTIGTSVILGSTSGGTANSIRVAGGTATNLQILDTLRFRSTLGAGTATGTITLDQTGGMQFDTVGSSPLITYVAPALYSGGLTVTGGLSLTGNVIIDPSAAVTLGLGTAATRFTVGTGTGAVAITGTNAKLYAGGAELLTTSGTASLATVSLSSTGSAASVPASGITGTTLAANVTGSSLTSLGTGGTLTNWTASALTLASGSTNLVGMVRGGTNGSIVLGNSTSAYRNTTTGGLIVANAPGTATNSVSIGAGNIAMTGELYWDSATDQFMSAGSLYYNSTFWMAANRFDVVPTTNSSFISFQVQNLTATASTGYYTVSAGTAGAIMTATGTAANYNATITAKGTAGYVTTGTSGLLITALTTATGTPSSGAVLAVGTDGLLKIRYSDGVERTIQTSP
jgi:hypothetical protein